MITDALGETELGRYHQDGYVLIKGMLDPEEVGLLRRAAHEDRVSTSTPSAGPTAKAAQVRLSLWNHPGDTIYGMFARCDSIVGSAEKLLDGEVYHYHSKMIMKDASVGGAWTWHQDYGYWYQNGVLFPLLTSVFIAVDPRHARERLPAGDSALARSRPHRPRPDRRPGRRRPGARRQILKRFHWSMSRWSPATPCSSTRTCCTAPTRTAPRIRAGR